MTNPDPVIVPLAGLSGWHHLALDDVDSTNTRALKEGQAGHPGKLWVTANRQLAGKARRGREWVSERGNLYASVLLVNPAAAEQLTTLPLIASLALHKALVAVNPGLAERLKIKWPNDLLLDGKKISGILLEAATSLNNPGKDDRNRLVVIGFGVNCRHSPKISLYKTTSLKEAGVFITADDLFPVLARFLVDELLNWKRGAGFAEARAEWIERAAGLGETVTVRFPDHRIEGRFTDIDTDGFLRLEDDKGQVQKISAADIFLGPAREEGT